MAQVERLRRALAIRNTQVGTEERGLLPQGMAAAVEEARRDQLGQVKMEETTVELVAGGVEAPTGEARQTGQQVQDPMVEQEGTALVAAEAAPEERREVRPEGTGHQEEEEEEDMD